VTPSPTVPRCDLLKPGGRIVYITCSLLNEENGDQIRDFLRRHPEFVLVPPAEMTQALGDRGFLFPSRRADDGRGIVDDAAAHRHGRFFRIHPGALQLGHFQEKPALANVLGRGHICLRSSPRKRIGVKIIHISTVMPAKAGIQ